MKGSKMGVSGGAVGGLWRWADFGGGRTLEVGGLRRWEGFGERWSGEARRGSGWGEQVSRVWGGSKGVSPLGTNKKGKP